MADEPRLPISAQIVDRIGERLEQAHDRNLPIGHAALQAFIDANLEAHEGDLASLVKPHIEHLATDETLPGPVRQLFAVLADPAHQTHFFTALFAIQGIINAFVSAALQPYVQEVSNKAWSNDQSMPLSPAEMALANLRNNLHGIDPYKESAQSGIDATRFDVLVGNTGEPPGLQQLNEAYRRDIIGDAELEKGIRESRVRNEWIPVVKALRYAPPSPAEVLRGSVQGFLDDARARKMFQEAGYADDNYEWLHEITGRPPGTMEMIELWRRGAVTEQEVIDAIRESDVKNKYITAILQMVRHIPPERTIVSGVRQGVLSDAEGRTKLGELGIRDDDATWLLAEAHATKMAAHKDLALGVVKTLYADGAMDVATATSHIIGLGYDANEAAQLLSVVDLAREHRYQQAAVQRVHTLYVSYHIDNVKVITSLDALHVAADERNALLDLWDLEREANAKVLTLAQLNGALHRGVIDRATFKERALLLGYHAHDLDILVANAYPPSKVPTDLVTVKNVT